MCITYLGNKWIDGFPGAYIATPSIIWLNIPNVLMWLEYGQIYAINIIHLMISWNKYHLHSIQVENTLKCWLWSYCTYYYPSGVMDGWIYGFPYNHINKTQLNKSTNCVSMVGGWPKLWHKHHTTREINIVWNWGIFHIQQVQHVLKGLPGCLHVHYYPGRSMGVWLSRSSYHHTNNNQLTQI